MMSFSGINIFGQNNQTVNDPFELNYNCLKNKKKIFVYISMIFLPKKKHAK